MAALQCLPYKAALLLVSQLAELSGQLAELSGQLTELADEVAHAVAVVLLLN